MHTNGVALRQMSYLPSPGRFREHISWCTLLACFRFEMLNWNSSGPLDDLGCVHVVCWLTLNIVAMGCYPGNSSVSNVECKCSMPYNSKCTIYCVRHKRHCSVARKPLFLDKTDKRSRYMRHTLSQIIQCGTIDFSGFFFILFLTKKNMFFYLYSTSKMLA